MTTKYEKELSEVLEAIEPLKEITAFSTRYKYSKAERDAANSKLYVLQKRKSWLVSVIKKGS